MFKEDNKEKLSIGRGDLDKLFESVKNKVDFVSNADNALDGKAGTLMGIEVAIAIGYLLLIFQNLENYSFWLGIFGLIFIVSSVAQLFYVNWPKKYITISVDISKHSDYFFKKENELLLQLISDAQNAFTKNSRIINKKVKWYRLAIIFFAVSAILFTLSLIT